MELVCIGRRFRGLSSDRPGRFFCCGREESNVGGVSSAVADVGEKLVLKFRPGFSKMKSLWADGAGEGCGLLCRCWRVKWNAKIWVRETVCYTASLNIFYSSVLSLEICTAPRDVKHACGCNYPEDWPIVHVLGCGKPLAFYRDNIETHGISGSSWC